MIGSISSQFSGENSFNEVGKTGSRSIKNLGEKQCPNPQIYRLRKTRRWGSVRPVGRPSCRPTTVKNPTVGASGRPPGRPKRTESTALSSGRLGQSTGHLPGQGVHVVHVGRPVRSTDFRYSRLAEARKQKSGIKKFVFLAQIKSHKILKILQK